MPLPLLIVSGWLFGFFLLTLSFLFSQGITGKEVGCLIQLRAFEIGLYQGMKIYV